MTNRFCIWALLCAAALLTACAAPTPKVNLAAVSVAPGQVITLIKPPEIKTFTIYAPHVGMAFGALLRPTLWVLGLGFVLVCLWGVIRRRRGFHLACLGVLALLWLGTMAFRPYGYEREAIELVPSAPQKFWTDVYSILRDKFPAARSARPCRSQPAVDHQLGGSDVARFIGSQEQYGVGTIPGVAHAADRNRGMAFRDQIGGGFGAQLFHQTFFDQGGVHGAEHHHIAADAFFDIGNGGGAGETVEAGFGGAVGDVYPAIDLMSESCNRGHIDDGAAALFLHHR